MGEISLKTRIFEFYDKIVIGDKYGRSMTDKALKTLNECPDSQGMNSRVILKKVKNRPNSLFLKVL